MTHKKILVINPNTSADMTATIAAAAQAAAQCDTHVDVITNTAGPRSIEGFFDEVLSTASLLEILIREERNYDAFIIACLAHIRRLSPEKRPFQNPSSAFLNPAAFLPAFWEVVLA